MVLLVSKMSAMEKFLLVVVGKSLLAMRLIILWGWGRSIGRVYSLLGFLHPFEFYISRSRSHHVGLCGGVVH